MGKIIVTGACGFIGTCLSSKMLNLGFEVIGLDNFSRKGTELNAEELKKHQRFSLRNMDVSDAKQTHEVFAQIGRVDAVFHLAAQVAVTTSYIDREKDFKNNAAASFNVIEAVKKHSPAAYCLYASTNKVYGHIEVNEPVGIDFPLDPYTPYGVSKATGELYFKEYGRKEIGLSTCSLRQSCIYGHHQFGVEDQGWVAWFAIANVLQVPLSIYGDGNQIRDLLYIDDLINLYLECFEKRLTGVYPTGGGRGNAITIKEGIALIEEITGEKYVDINYNDMRPGDQPYFVADLSWTTDYGIDWVPQVRVRDGLEKMISWIFANKTKIRSVVSF